MQDCNKYVDMVNRYIVAVDDSEAGLNAVREAIETVKNENGEAKLELVHVLSQQIRNNGSEMIIEQPDANEDAGNGVLEKASKLVPNDVPYDTEIIHGKPSTSIVERASEIDAMKVFIGHRERDKYNGVKSVAKKVVSDAPCAVIVVKKNKKTTSQD